MQKKQKDQWVTRESVFAGPAARYGRDARFRQLRDSGIKHIIRRTGQENGQMTYIVAWSEKVVPPPPKPEVAEAVAEAEKVLAEIQTEVPLTTDSAPAKVVPDEPKPFRGKVELPEV